MHAITMAEVSAFLSVIVVDLVLAGDNAIVVGMVAANLPKETRRKVILVGIVAATVLRVIFASIAQRLLQIIGLTLAGGVLLLWVAWKLWREIRQQRAQTRGTDALGNGAADGAGKPPVPAKSFRTAVIQIVLADISMSLDNVIAVAGVARDHPFILGFGLVLSVALMAVASTLVARLLKRYHWIAYIGLAIIAYVALHMIWDGSMAVLDAADVSFLP